MGNGLLAWWRRRIAARGMAGAALLAVPVAVAAAIGFGTSISGVAGGLSSVTSGPDAAPASAQTSPSKLNHAVVALAREPAPTNGPGSAGNGAGGGAIGGGSTNSTPAGTGVGTGSGSGSNSGGGGGGGGSSLLGGGGSEISAPNAPNLGLPGGGGVNNTVDGVTNGASNTVNGATNGANNTVNGLLGRK
jgi:hypothetical protein